MWLAFAIGSALFAGLTTILAKCGVRTTDSNVATLIRTGVVLVFSCIMVAIAGSAGDLVRADARTLLFLALSGLATGASWLCYFKALQVGDVNKVVPVDKSSTVLTILLAFLFLGETVTPVRAAGVVLIGAGTLLMIERRDVAPRAAGGGLGWFVYAAGSAVFAALQAIIGKVGIEGIESNLGTAVRTAVVLVMALVMILVTRRGREVLHVRGRELLFIVLSGLATGGSWLCYWRALQEGPASVVVPIDKLSILVTALFAFLVFGERLSRKSALGLAAIVAGTLAMIA